MTSTVDPFTPFVPPIIPWIRRRNNLFDYSPYFPHTWNHVHRASSCDFLTACFRVVITTAGSVPNVLVILTEDQGWADLSLQGNGNLSKPRLNAFATAGTRFKRLFDCTVYSPTTELSS